MAFTPSPRDLRLAYLNAIEYKTPEEKKEVGEEFDRAIEQIDSRAKLELLGQLIASYPNFTRDMVSRNDVISWLEGCKDRFTEPKPKARAVGGVLNSKYPANHPIWDKRKAMKSGDSDVELGTKGVDWIVV